jgi:hypothetical protein
MSRDPEGARSDLPPQAGRVHPGGITRDRAKLVAAVLLGAGEIAIAVARLGLLDFHDVVRYSQDELDLDNIVRSVVGLLGLALAVAGIVYLTYIWAADRFRVSIGRLMLVVALVAVLLLVVIVLRQREQARRTPGPPAAPSTGRK